MWVGVCARRGAFIYVGLCIIDRHQHINTMLEQHPNPHPHLISARLYFRFPVRSSYCPRQGYISFWIRYVHFVILIEINKLNLWANSSVSCTELLYKMQNWRFGFYIRGTLHLSFWMQHDTSKEILRYTSYTDVSTCWAIGHMPRIQCHAGDKRVLNRNTLHTDCYLHQIAIASNEENWNASWCFTKYNHS